MSILTICIPTYNRVDDLTYNIRIIHDIITSNNLFDDVSVIISDNGSPDNTTKIIKDEISTYKKTDIQIFTQKSNLGGVKNTLFLLEHATTEFCMLLGDDDFICADYLVRIIYEIKTNKSITCIFPSNQAITPEKQQIKNLGRDLNCKTRYYKKGFVSCCHNIGRSTQLSGLTFKKGQLVELFRKKNMDNLYPQTFFMMSNCLKGKALHLTDYPVLISHIPQSQKDWDYEKDALLSDQFENCINLDLSVIKCSILEIITIIKTKYLLRELNYKVIKVIRKEKTTTYFAGCFLILYLPYIKFEKRLKKLYWKARSLFSDYQMNNNIH